ncbi:methyltransferase domain-containing protein [Agromyces sp. H66]|uniref:TRM11 family SAM-dependent methyltransferase n=1 Tax=Agromyces sp. H66 TaxID=2529859 RepID=UPI00145AF709|nr:methyltransferase domain-containing protein [Agromyces sp. H66]
MPAIRREAARSLDRARPSSITPPPSILVRTVNGLEELTAAGLAREGHRVLAASKRQFVVEPRDDSILTDPPRTADDVFPIVASIPDPGRSRQCLDPLSTALARADLTAGVRMLRARDLRRNVVFSATASLTGRRNYSRHDLEDAVGRVLARRLGAAYHSRRGGIAPPPEAIDWRVTADGTLVRVGLRASGTPLHRRAWRRATVAGSIHPPVAAAMAELARLEPGLRVLDPCCGAGTILIEAAHAEPDGAYVGGDHDADAVRIATGNADGHPGIVWRVGDAVSLPDASGSIDRIISNPPWGVQVHERHGLPHLLSEWRRVLRDDGLLVVLVDEGQEPALAGSRHWDVVRTLPLSVAGRHPRIVVARPS